MSTHVGNALKKTTRQGAAYPMDVLGRGASVAMEHKGGDAEGQT